MNHRIEKLSTLLDANKTPLNVANTSEISIQRENALNEASDNNSCSSTIKVEPLLMSESKRSKVNSSNNQNIYETINSNQLNIHNNRIHSKQKRFACDQCPKTFTKKSNLLIHKKQHTGEMPFQYDSCSKKFLHLSKLIIHKRIHTGEKPYQCDSCPKKFAQSSNLTLHKRMRTKERSPFIVTLVK
jgi:uncharacterized Zn-finger protein